MPGYYHINLEKFSLEKFRLVLEMGDLLPSRKMLKDRINERFAILERRGIRNLKGLVEALGSKKKIEQFAKDTGLPQEYLELLLRQTKIYRPAAIALKEFPGVDAEYIELLAQSGIRQTKQLFERAATRRDRESLSTETGVPSEVLLELVKLSDLARAGWVGPVFARLIYLAGVETIEALVGSVPEALYKRLVAVNAEKALTKGSFTVKDIASCIDIARQLDIVVSA